MAKAPRPGVSKRNEEAAEAQQILVMRFGDDEYRLAWRNLPFAEQMLCRQWTGVPWDSFTRLFGADALVLYWFFARRMAGEKTLVFHSDETVAEFDRMLAACGGQYDLEIVIPGLEELLSDEDADPEA